MINNILLSTPQPYEVPISSLDMNREEPDTTFEDMIKNSKNANEESSVNNKPDNEKNPVSNSRETSTSYKNDESRSDSNNGTNKEDGLKKNSDKVSDEKGIDKGDKKEKKIKTDDLLFFEKIESDTSVNVETVELIKDIEMLIENMENILESDNALSDASKSDIKDILTLLDGIKNLLQNKSSLNDKNLMFGDAENLDLGVLKSLLSESADVEGIEKLLSNMNSSKSLESVIAKLEATLDLKLNMKENSNTVSDSENTQAFDNIDRDISNGEATSNFGKDSNSGGGENNNSKNSSKPTMVDTNSTTEFTIVNTKDDFSRSEFISSKTVNQTKTDVSELLSKFQDVMTKLVSKARMALSNGKTEIIMALKPDSLGNVSLKMIMEGDEIRGKIFVDNAEIRDIFTKNLDTVIKSLSEVGINIEGFDVMLRQDMPSRDQEEFSDLLGERGDDTKESNDKIAKDAENSLMIDKYLLPERKLNIII